MKCNDPVPSTRTDRMGAGLTTLSVAGLLLTAGCLTVGPDYQKPQVYTPAAWVGTGAWAVATGTAPTTNPAAQPSVPLSRPVTVTNWWSTFKDPILDSLVTRAVQTNLDLKQAESRVHQARAQRRIAYAGFWPSVDASGSLRCP